MRSPAATHNCIDVQVRGRFTLQIARISTYVGQNQYKDRPPCSLEQDPKRFPMIGGCMLESCKGWPTHRYCTVPWPQNLFRGPEVKLLRSNGNRRI
jgi:hypothetical protein